MCFLFIVMHGAQADGLYQEQPQHHWHTHCSLYTCNTRIIRIKVIIVIITIVMINNNNNKDNTTTTTTTIDYYSNAFQLIGS